MLRLLELRIPPVILLLICAALMWAIALFLPSLTLRLHPYFHTVFPIFLLVLGSSLVMSGIFAFYRMDTTVNPILPELTSSLVMTGVYRYSRNPIYLGLVMILLSWGIYLSNILSLLFVIVFIRYMNRFQIEPEERMLHKLFGAQFEKYQCKVRRWI
jgi:protein-S-isoprenylcysteine O-methyltransferase Ste14